MGPNHLMHPAFALIPRTRQHILWFIKTEGAAQAETIADKVDISVSGIRQHLTTLEAEGLLTHAEVRDGPGRPRHLYSLTTAAEAFFPSGYAQLADELLQGLDEEDPALLTRLIQRRAQRRLDELSKRVSKLPFEERVRVIAAQMDQDGFLVDVETRPDGSYVIVERNCAMLSIARKYGQICSSELDILQKLLPEANIQRVKYMVAGQSSCAYLIERLAA